MALRESEEKAKKAKQEAAEEAKIKAEQEAEMARKAAELAELIKKKQEKKDRQTEDASMNSTNSVKALANLSKELANCLSIREKRPGYSVGAVKESVIQARCNNRDEIKKAKPYLSCLLTECRAGKDIRDSLKKMDNCLPEGISNSCETAFYTFDYSER